MTLAKLFAFMFAASGYYNDIEIGAGVGFRDYARVCNHMNSDALTACVRDHGGANPLGELFLRTHPTAGLELQITHQSSLVDDADNYEPETPLQVSIRYIWKMKK